MPSEIPSDEELKNNSSTGIWISVVLFFTLISLTAYLRFGHTIGSAGFMLQIYIIFDVLVLIGAFMLRKEIIPALKIEKINWNILSGVIGGAIVMGFLFHYMVKFINHGLYDSSFNMYMFDETNYPLLFSYLGICLQPAIFEELAYRGAVYGSLQKHMDERSIVIVSAMLFAMAHLSPVGMIWLLPLGLILGWLRMHTKCLWYGVIFHMLYNFSAILVDAHERGIINF
jgi:membrane protease YdiL (CAAX protease family)